MTLSNSFEIGDIVAVFGGEVGKKGNKANSVSVCTVLAVGELDVLVEEPGTRIRSLSTHVVPKAICFKLKMNPDNLKNKKSLVPQIGDLVLSYSKDTYRSEEVIEVTGILFNTVYKLGKPHTCTLISGDEMKEVSYNDLIVLQRKSKD